MKDPRVLRIALRPEDCITQEDTDKIGEVISNMCVAIRRRAPVENDAILLYVAIEMLCKMLADFCTWEVEEQSIAICKTDEEFEQRVEEHTPPKKGPLQ